MKKLFLLAVVGGLTLGGWAISQQQELLDHGSNLHMQKMEDAGCTPPANPGGK